jgi:DNA-binding XRE family transcriptional regulator
MATVEATLRAHAQRRVVQQVLPGRPPGGRGVDTLSAQAFGSVIREVRLLAGLPQEALAHAADLDQTHVYQVERGLLQPSLFAMLKLSAALRYRAPYLLAATEREMKRSTAKPRMAARPKR